MNSITKQLLEENIKLIEEQDLTPIYRYVAEKILPIYWTAVFKELNEIFNNLGFDTIAPRVECLIDVLQDFEYEYSTDIEEGYIQNGNPFVTMLNRYGVCRFGFNQDDLIKYVKNYTSIKLQFDAPHWRVFV